MTSGSYATMFSTFSRANGRLPSTRIAILLSLVAMALLLGQFNSFGETLDNVSNTSTVAALQKAIQDGQALVTSYAGSAAAGAAAAAGLYGSSSSENKAPTLSKEKAAKLKAKRYIVLPATAPNPGFCRTLFALLINEYGAPTIVNWGGTAGTNHYAKITAGHEWLHAGGNDDDVVLTIDAHDVWPQLPAEAFFQQYADYPESPGAIIGAEKHCYPHPENHPRCMRLPPSPLPLDVYGEFTDKLNKTGKYGAEVDINPDLDDKSTWVWGRYETVRPRYVNSGTLVGTRKQLKALYTAGLRKMNMVEAGELNVTRVGSDQEIFGLVNLDRLNARREPLITPDVHLRLFQVMAHSYKDLYPRPMEELIADLPDDQRLILKRLSSGDWSERQMASNRISNTVPTFIHFAGPKPALEIWWRRMWWMQEEEDATHKNGAAGLFGGVGRNSRPVDTFLDHLKHHSQEKDGNGIKLANGTWFGFDELCKPFYSSILVEDSSEEVDSKQWGA